jgi:hypothetical protein
MPRRNPETLVNVQTDVGITLGIIDTSRRTGRPAGLRRPWDYMLSIPEIAALNNAFWPLFEEIAGDEHSPEAYAGPDRARRSYVPARGHTSIRRKPTGVKFHVSITATSTYTSRSRWDEICTRFQQILTDHLGPDARAYLSDYEPGHYGPGDPCYELYARFDAQIYYSEYQPIQEASRELDRIDSIGRGEI